MTILVKDEAHLKSWVRRKILNKQFKNKGFVERVIIVNHPNSKDVWITSEYESGKLQESCHTFKDVFGDIEIDPSIEYLKIESEEPKHFDFKYLWFSLVVLLIMLVSYFI